VQCRQRKLNSQCHRKKRSALKSKVVDQPIPEQLNENVKPPMAPTNYIKEKKSNPEYALTNVRTWCEGEEEEEIFDDWHLCQRPTNGVLLPSPKLLC
jgi:hypothetical protein